MIIVQHYRMGMHNAELELHSRHTNWAEGFPKHTFHAATLITKTMCLLSGSQCVLMAHVVGYGDDFFTNQDPEPYLFQSDNELSVTNASNGKK